MFAQFYFDVAALGDFNRVHQRLWQIAEQLGHFFGAFQVLLVAVVFRAARVVQRPAFTDADTGFVGFEVFLPDEAHIVGRHQWRADCLCQRYRCMQMLFVIGTFGALNLEIEPVREYGHPFAGQNLGLFSVATDQRDADFTLLG